MATIEFYYNGSSIDIKAIKETKMEDIFNKFREKAGIEKNSLIYLYSGTKITNYQLTFEQLANFMDKERNIMNILALEIENKELNKNEVSNDNSNIFSNDLIETNYSSDITNSQINTFFNSDSTINSTNIQDLPLYSETNVTYETIVTDPNINPTSFPEEQDYSSLISETPIISTNITESEPQIYTTISDSNNSANIQLEPEFNDTTITESISSPLQLTNTSTIDISSLSNTPIFTLETPNQSIYSTTTTNQQEYINGLSNSTGFATTIVNSSFSEQLDNNINIENLPTYTTSIMNPTGYITSTVSEPPIFTTEVSEKPVYATSTVSEPPVFDTLVPEQPAFTTTDAIDQPPPINITILESPGLTTTIEDSPFYNTSIPPKFSNEISNFTFDSSPISNISDERNTINLVQPGDIVSLPPGTMVPVKVGNSIVYVPTQPINFQYKNEGNMTENDTNSSLNYITNRTINPITFNYRLGNEQEEIPLPGCNCPKCTELRNKGNRIITPNIRPVAFINNINNGENEKPLPGCNCPKCTELRKRDNQIIGINIMPIPFISDINDGTNEKPLPGCNCPKCTELRKRDNQIIYPITPSIQIPLPGCNCPICRGLRNNYL